MPSLDHDQAIGAILARLWLHYPNPDYSPAHWRALTEDYVEELRRYPLEAIDAGAKACRRKLKFRPSISEMIAEIAPRVPKLRAVEGPTARPAPVLTDEERARRKAAADALPDGVFKRFALIACNPRVKP